MEMRRFVILAAPRSGSNLLCTLLQSHDQVLCHHELFNPGGIFVALPLRNTDFNLGTVSERDAEPHRFLQRVWAESPAASCVGFKMTHRQNESILRAVCADPGIHKIVLRRQARLKTYVSQLLAERSGVWEDYRDVPPQRPLPVTVDYARLTQALAYNDEYYAELDQLIRGPRSDVDYEDLFDHPVQQQLLHDLKLPPQPLFAASRHQNPFPLSILIHNLDDLRRQLQRAPADRSLLEELERAAA
ncbi:MAG: hypothetical protein Tsb002_06490 [Wenzhouxiangellaceae bacterium]